MATDIAKLTMTVDSADALKAASDLNKLAASAGKAETNIEQLGIQSNKSKKPIDGLGGAGKGAGNKLQGMGKNAGQAGIQIQQFVGQVQGGQSAMLALSQQAADLGIVLGAPLVGVIVALAASMGGILVNSLNSSQKELEETEELVDQLIDRMDELNAASLEFVISQIRLQREEFLKVGDQASTTAARIQTLERYLEQFPSNKKAEDWRKELKQLEAQADLNAITIKDFDDQLAALGFRLDELRRKSKDTTDTLGSDDLEILSLIGQYAAYGEGRAAAESLAQGAAEQSVRASKKSADAAQEALIWLSAEKQAVRELAEQLSLYGAGRASIADILIQSVTDEEEAEKAKLKAQQEADLFLSQRSQTYSNYAEQYALYGAGLLEIDQAIFDSAEMQIQWDEKRAESAARTADEIAAQRQREVAAASNAINAIGGMVVALGSVEENESRKSFENTKKLRYGQALASGLAGALNIWADPTMTNVERGLSLAALSATTIGNLATIKGMQYGGGGSVKADVPAVAGAYATTNNTTNTSNLTVNVSGGDPDNIIRVMKEFYANDGITHTRDSAQARQA